MNIHLPPDFGRILSGIEGKWLQRGNDSPIKFLSLDSRKISEPASTLFIAIHSTSQRGENFIDALYQKGVRNFIFQDADFTTKPFPEANFFLVKDSIKALQEMAIMHRTQFTELPVIGITGSNGKTVVKEWLHHLLIEEYTMVRSPGSFNSQIGVPLSMLKIRDYHTLGVFEAGISMSGEMEKLERMIQPAIGIFTNIGQAHDEGFENKKQKIREKLTLFEHADVLIYPADDNILDEEIRKFSIQRKISLKGVGTSNDAAIRIDLIEKAERSTRIIVTAQEFNFEITIPFTDAAAIENALHCLAVLVHLVKTGPKVLEKFGTLFPVAMRLEMKGGIHHSVLINDSYSNDLHSLTLALNFLESQSPASRRMVILSDIAASGLAPEILYREVADLLVQKQVSTLVAIGPNLSRFRNYFSRIGQVSFYENTTAFQEQFPLNSISGKTVLIKGARSFKLEKISALMEMQSHQTVLTVNLSHLAHNIKVYRNHLRPGTKIMAMVKAFGYGTGSERIAAVLDYHRVDYLAVAYADEGAALRNAGISLPVMVMNTTPPQFENIVRFHLEPEIYSLTLLREFVEYMRWRGMLDYPVHFKIDSGMHRLGIMEDEMETIIQMLTDSREIKLKSIFSHLSAADDPKEDAFTRSQFQQFMKMADSVCHAVDYPVMRHIANTAAIDRFRDFQLDMVRPGIGLYGLANKPGVGDQLKNVASLHTTISQIKQVKAAERVGYGSATMLHRDSVIATVGIGYADGYSRALSNGRGSMHLKGKPARVLGNICMDMTMLDITGIADVQEGDEVQVFGDQLSVADVAQWAGTIPYEILAGISSRVRRLYVEE